jgi:hypothetical protein
MHRIIATALTICALTLTGVQTALADPAAQLTGRVVGLLVAHGTTSHLLFDQRLARDGEPPSWVKVVTARGAGPGAGETLVARLAVGRAVHVGDLVELAEEVSLDSDTVPRRAALIVRSVIATAHAVPGTPPAVRMTVVSEHGRLFVRAVAPPDPPLLLARP